MVILPSYAGGGAEKVLLSFISKNTSKSIDIKLFVVNSIGPLKKIAPVDAIEFKNKHFIFSLPSLIVEIRKNKIDVLISTFPNTSAILLFLKKIGVHNCRIIVRQPNMVEPSLSKTLKLRLLKYFYKKFIIYTDLLIVTSEAMKKESLKNKVKKNKIRLLRNPIDSFFLRKNVIPIRKPHKGIKLVFVGRIVFQKGLDRILPAIKKVKNIKLTIIGSGNEKEPLIKIINQLGIEDKVEFLGYIEKPGEIVAGSDYFIIPSRWEGLPNSVLESLALGTPVIAFSEVVGLKDFRKNISDKSILIVNNELQLYKKLKELKPRKDSMVPKLRKSLLYSYISNEKYQNKLNELIRNVQK